MLLSTLRKSATECPGCLKTSKAYLQQRRFRLAETELFWVCSKCNSHVDSGKDSFTVLDQKKEIVGVLWVCPSCSHMRLELGDAKYLDISGEKRESTMIEIYESNFFKAK